MGPDFFNEEELAENPEVSEHPEEPLQDLSAEGAAGDVVADGLDLVLDDRVLHEHGQHLHDAEFDEDLKLAFS